MRVDRADHLARVRDHFDITADFWKDVYGENTVSGALYRERMNAVLRMVESLDLPAGSPVLEIGCGAGLVTVALAERGLEVQAVDVVPQMVTAVLALARQRGVESHVSARLGDVHKLDFPDRSFALVLAIGVLEWTPTLEAPLAEMRRVLRSGGKLIVNVDNSRALHCLIDPRLNPLLNGVKRQVRLALESAGLRKPLARPGRCSPGRLNRALVASGFRRLVDHSGGFGPITLLKFGLLPETVGVRLHDLLQRLADRGVPLLRYGGETYLTLSVLHD